MYKLFSALGVTVVDTVIATLLVVFGWDFVDSLGLPVCTFGITVTPAFLYVVWRLKDPYWKHQATWIVMFGVGMSVYGHFRERMGIPLGQPLTRIETALLVGLALLCGTIDAVIKWHRRISTRNLSK